MIAGQAMSWEDSQNVPRPWAVVVLVGSRDIQLHAVVVVPVDADDEMDTSGCRAQRSAGRA